MVGAAYLLNDRQGVPCRRNGVRIAALAVELDRLLIERIRARQFVVLGSGTARTNQGEGNHQGDSQELSRPELHSIEHIAAIEEWRRGDAACRYANAFPTHLRALWGFTILKSLPNASRGERHIDGRSEAQGDDHGR